MSSYNDIELYRKKKRKKKILKKLFLLIFTIFIFITIFVIGIFFNKHNKPSTNKEFMEDKLSSNKTYPINLFDEKGVSIKSLNNYIVALTEQRVRVFNENGEQMNSIAHNYSNPILKTSNKNILTYNQSGYNMMVNSRNSLIYEKEYSKDETILFGEISDNGYVAIVTTSLKYASVLTVYNDVGAEVFKWYSNDKQVMSLDFNKSGNGCVVATSGVVDGNLNTNLTFLEFTKQKEILNVNLGETLAVSVSCKNNGNINFIGDNKSIILDSKGKIISSFDFETNLKHFSNNASNYTVLVLNDINKRDIGDIIVINSDGQIVNKISIIQTIKNIYCDGSRVLVLTPKGVLDYDMSLNLLNTIDVQKDAIDLTLIGTYGYIIGINEITKKNIN